MKKLISLILVLSLVLGLGVSASAAGLDNFALRAQYGDFTDVPESEWYWQSVRTANEYGLMKGNPDGSFDPNGQLTVAGAIVMADRVHMIYNTGEDTLENGDPWYQTYVDYAIENDLIAEDDFDDYNRPVTRGEMAYIFSSAVPYGDFEEINAPDNAIAPDIAGHKYEKAIKLLYVYGIATGNDMYGAYAPDSNIKRAEAAAIIARVVEPEQRRAVMLMADYEFGAVTAAVPVGSEEEKTVIEGYTDCVDIIYGPAGLAIYKAEDITGGVEGLSVLNIPRDAQAAEIEAVLGVSVVSSTVDLGATPAYRFDFTIDEGGAYTTGCYFVTLADCDLYTIVAAVQHPDSTIDGAYADVLADLMSGIRIK